jgi:hypothetical protein
MFKTHMYLDLWWSMVHVVIEGYEKLGLSYPEVEPLLVSSERRKLSKYPSGTFHFTEQYLDPDKFVLYGDAGMEWMHQLYMKMGEPMLADLSLRRKASIPPSL